MKKKRISTLEYKNVNRAIGIQDSSLYLTRIVSAENIPSTGSNDFWRKIVEFKNSSFVLSLLITGSIFSNVPPSVYNVGISTFEPFRIYSSVFSKFGSGNDGMVIKYKISEGTVRVWIKAPYSGSINVLCLSGNYQPSSITELPPEDAITLIG